MWSMPRGNIVFSSSPATSHQPALLHGGLDEGGEQRVRSEWAGLQLGMALHADEPGMVGIFDNLRQAPTRRHAAEMHAALLEPPLVGSVDLVAVAVALGNVPAAVNAGDPASWREMRRIGAKPHCAAEIAVQL